MHGHGRGGLAGDDLGRMQDDAGHGRVVGHVVGHGAKKELSRARGFVFFGFFGFFIQFVWVGFDCCCMKNAWVISVQEFRSDVQRTFECR